jgi:DNA-binding SARP family transcriptional activator
MRFGILGPFEVADDQGRELALGGHRQRAVLAILLLHAGEVVSSDRLIEDLWGKALGRRRLRRFRCMCRAAQGAR